MPPLWRVSMWLPWEHLLFVSAPSLSDWPVLFMVAFTTCIRLPVMKPPWWPLPLPFSQVSVVWAVLFLPAGSLGWQNLLPLSFVVPAGVKWSVQFCSLLYWLSGHTAFWVKENDEKNSRQDEPSKDPGP